MHFADGSIVPSDPITDGGWEAVGNGGGVTHSRIYFFPWTANAYDEAWIEWRFGGQTYWFEIPYGFTRRPTEPWADADGKRSTPVLAPAMQNLTEQEKLIPWLHVGYELGEIGNHWRLSARMANPFRPAAEGTLSQAPDENMISWEADKPKIGIEMKGESPGAKIAFHKRGGLERIDTFRIAYDGPDEGRGGDSRG